MEQAPAVEVIFGHDSILLTVDLASVIAPAPTLTLTLTLTLTHKPAPAPMLAPTPTLAPVHA